MAGGGALRLRTEDPSYLALVDRWWAVLLPRIARHLYIRGGNVLMVQARRSARSSLVECLPTSVCLQPLQTAGWHSAVTMCMRLLCAWAGRSVCDNDLSATRTTSRPPPAGL